MAGVTFGSSVSRHFCSASCLERKHWAHVPPVVRTVTCDTETNEVDMSILSCISPLSCEFPVSCSVFINYSILLHIELSVRDFGGRPHQIPGPEYGVDI